MGLSILAAGTSFNFGLPAESSGTGKDFHGLSGQKRENFLPCLYPILGTFLLAATSLERAFFTSPGFLGSLTILRFRGSFFSLAFLGPFSLASLGFLGGNHGRYLPRFDFLFVLGD